MGRWVAVSAAKIRVRCLAGTAVLGAKEIRIGRTGSVGRPPVQWNQGSQRCISRRAGAQSLKLRAGVTRRHGRFDRIHAPGLHRGHTMCEGVPRVSRPIKLVSLRNILSSFKNGTVLETWNGFHVYVTFFQRAKQTKLECAEMYN